MEGLAKTDSAAEACDGGAAVSTGSNPSVTKPSALPSSNAERVVLEQRWLEATGQPVPHALTGKLLVGALSYEEQCRSNGGLTLQQQRMLKRLATASSASSGSPSQGAASGRSDYGKRRLKDRLPFAIGTEFVREWQGRDHIVIMTPDGLLWSGQTFSSLSAVARAITGTRWNGRRFFGVQQDEKEQR